MFTKHVHSDTTKIDQKMWIMWITLLITHYLGKIAKNHVDNQGLDMDIHKITKL